MSGQGLETRATDGGLWCGFQNGLDARHSDRVQRQHRCVPNFRISDRPSQRGARWGRVAGLMLLFFPGAINW